MTGSEVGRARHAAELLRLAVPLAVAQLSQIAMGVTDTVLLGSLGGPALAAGGLGASLFFTTNILLQGVIASVSVLVSHARGGGQPQRVPLIYWTGLALCALLVLPGFAWLSMAEPFLRAIGEPPELAHDVGRYLNVLRWGLPGGVVGIGLMRAFLTAIGASRILLFVTPVMMVANGVLNYGLIHGRWGLPALGLIGSATATACTLWASAAVLLAILHLRRGLRRFVRPAGIRFGLLRELLAIGLPTGAMYGVETWFFLTTGLAMGWLGPAALAAHQVAINVASTCFMVPLAIAQAANVRVGFWTGSGRRAEARRAGFVAIGMGAAFMAVTGLGLLLAPRLIISAYLDPAAPANQETVRIATALLGIAAVFQVADGVQVIAAGSLRGLKDTRVPMLIASFGYWAVGFLAGYGLAFWSGLGPPGLWWGLAAGLAAVATMLTLRFAALTAAPIRFGRAVRAR